MKPAEGIQGPGLAQEPVKNGDVLVEMPKFIQIKTQEERQQFQSMVENIIRAANKNALDLLAQFVEKQNLAMDELVKKLGG